MPTSNRFCLPYISPGVSFVCLDKKYLERLNKHLDLLGPLIRRSQPLGYDNWRIFVQEHTSDIPHTFTLVEAPAKEIKRNLLSGWKKQPGAKKLLELPVYPLERFNDFEHFDIICSSDKLAPLRLRSGTAKNTSLFFLSDNVRTIKRLRIFEELFLPHEEKIRQVAELLKMPGDSKLLLGSVLPLKSRFFVYSRISDFPEYFHPNVSPQVGDIVISGGVSENAVSELEFSRTVGTSGKVYAFEPDPAGARAADEFFARYPETRNIEIVPFGLWNKTETVTFVSGLGQGSFVKNSTKKTLEIMDKTKNKVGSVSAYQAAREIVVPMISLDEFVKDRGLNRLDFIKLDIEGSELAALEGARQSFLKFAPRFAISIYHNPEDIWTIPLFIKSLEKDGLRYELYFGLHSQSSFSEMVLYGKPANSDS